MPPKKAQQLGALIKKEREAKGLSIRGLAAAVGIDPSAVLHFERGSVGSPDPKKLLRIARTLEIPVEDLYALAGYTAPEGLPEFVPYLRAKYDVELPDRAAKEVEEYVAQLKERYGGKKGGHRGKRH